MLEERAVVAQEFNSRFVEDPYFQINQQNTRALLGGTGHARSVIGTPEAIRQFEITDAREFHQKTHQMKNATLLITGNSSPRQLARWLGCACALLMPEENDSDISPVASKCVLGKLILTGAD